MSTLREQWKHRSTYHPPKTEHRQSHERVNAVIFNAGDYLIELCPESSVDGAAQFSKAKLRIFGESVNTLAYAVDRR